jgi:hypothetical protein
VLGFGAVWFCGLMPTFRRNALSSSLGLKRQSWELEGLCSVRGRKTGEKEQRQGAWEKGFGPIGI